MTIETIPNTDIQYYLLAYDKNGQERDNDPDAINNRQFRTGRGSRG